MAKVFRPSNREASILSKIESSKEHARRRTINNTRDNINMDEVPERSAPPQLEEPEVAGGAGTELLGEAGSSVRAIR